MQVLWCVGRRRVSTSIEWTDVTWNPVTGCDRVSPGCAHCYALTLAKRLKAMGHPAYQVDGGKASGPGFAVQLHAERLEAPLHWRAPRRVFVNSMSDLFHEDVPYEFIRRVFDVMRCCDGGVVAATGQRQPSHIFQVLTKRPERMLELAKTRALGFDPDKPPKNIWLGVSVENQRFADERIPLLLQTPAAVRFLSCEPLLGPVDLRRIPPLDAQYGCDGGPERDGARHRGHGSPECPRESHHHHDERCKFPIDWVIVGGESGPNHRPFDPDWARAIRDQFPERAGVKLFVKQLGGLRPGGKLEDLPEDLRIREFPA